MQITQSRIEPDIDVVALVGRLTLGRETTAFEAAIDALLAKGARKVVLDFSQLDYIDSAGLGVILSAASKLKQAGGSARLAKVGTRVMQVLKLTHTDSVLSLDPDVAASAAQFA
jgi:anti-anti-sigma factor